MRKRSKRYKADAAKVDIAKKYGTPEAVKILKSFTPTKADQSIEIAVKLAPRSLMSAAFRLYSNVTISLSPLLLPVRHCSLTALSESWSMVDPELFTS